MAARRAICACLALLGLMLRPAGGLAQETVRQVEVDVAGFNASEVDASVTTVLIEALRGVPGVEVVGALSEPGRATLYVRGNAAAEIAKIASLLPAEASRPRTGPVQKRATFGPHVVIEVDGSRLDANGFEADDVRRALLRADGVARPEEVGGLVLGLREGTPIRLLDVAAVRRAEAPAFDFVVAVADESADRVERRLDDIRRAPGIQVVAALPEGRSSLHVGLERERVIARGTSFPAALLRTADGRAAGFALVRGAKPPRVEGARTHARGAIPVEVRVLLGLGAE